MATFICRVCPTPCALIRDDVDLQMPDMCPWIEGEAEWEEEEDEE